MTNLKKKGFTIVELVIVIAVIAILAAVLIPTFSNLIKKANESSDIQLVRQMNVILEQDEVLNGKPANTDGVKKVLAANGISNPTPAYADSAFAWDSEENVIVLVNKETQKGVFPNEYKDVDFKKTWELLAGTVNVTLEDLNAGSLDEALENVELGQTIKLTSNQTLNATTLPKNVEIDLNNQTLTLPNGLPMKEYGNITLSNGKVESAQISVSTGATLTLDAVEFKSSDSCAFFPETASSVNISNSTIISNCPIGTNYSDNTSRAIDVNITNSTLGSEESPCSIGIMLITSGNVTISDCTIYASGTGILNRAGNVTVKDTVINYMPQKAYSDTYLDPVIVESTYKGSTPGSVRQQMWKNGSGGFNAPIVVGDFWAKHYSFDANCILINVEIVNNTTYEYPDVYLSQENYDIFKWQAGVRKPDFNNRVAGTEEIVKTTLTCDNTITWAVNPGKNDVFIDDCVDGMEPFAAYSGFAYSNGTYGGVAALYVDNVFVNGVEQAPGSTSENNIVAGNLAVNIPSFVGTFTSGEYNVSMLNVNYPSNVETYDYTDEVIQALKDDCGLELTKEQLISATLSFGSTKNYLKSVTYTKDGASYTQAVKGNVTTGRLAIDAIAHLELTGNQSGSVLLKTNNPVSYFEIFKNLCEERGITLTENSKIVVGANNTIIDIK